MKITKKYLLLFFFLVPAMKISAQNEVGPDGNILFGGLLILVVIVALFFIFRKKETKDKPLFKIEKLNIELGKNRLYFPDYLVLNIKNTGNCDIDVDRPLMVFDRFWMKRKFRLKGTENRTFYPLYMVKGYNHTLNIDLNHFYSYDKKLKNYPKVKITIFNVKGKRLGSKTVYLRKTLIKY